MGEPPSLYVKETCEYRSSLGKLIRELRISLPMKTIVKKLKALVAFFSNKNWRAAGPPPPLIFSQNRSIKTMRKPFSQKK